MDTGLAIEFTGTYDNVSLSSSCIRAICHDAAFTDKNCGLITNGVVEALNNIIEYAYNGKEDGTIRLIIIVASDRLIFKVSHPGTFPKMTVKPSLDYDPKDIEKLPEGGMGLYIIDQVMDNTSYEYKDSETIITMTKYRDKSTAGNIK